MSDDRPMERQFAPGLDGLKQSTDDDVPDTEGQIRILVEDAVAANASDIHFDPHPDNYRIRFRVDGVLHDVGTLERETGERHQRYFKTAASLDPGNPFEPQVGHLHMDLHGTPWELRLTAVPTPEGNKMALRLLNPERLDLRLAQLGMAPRTMESFEHWLEDSVGMALVVGPTGSGKTTTLYALLHELKGRPRNIVTIEDPVEYAVEGVTQIQVKDDSGLTFEKGLRTMLRLDPDYLMVGELRDEESSDMAIDAAGAGHLLLGTLHGRDAVGAVTMLRNYKIEDHKIAAALELVVAQRLVRKLCKKCREEGEPTESESAWLERNGLTAPERSWRAKGCGECRESGYDGRLGVFEVWRVDGHFEQMILDHADELTLRRELLATEQPILLQDGLEKVNAGKTSISEIQSMRAGAQGYLLRGRDGSG